MTTWLPHIDSERIALGVPAPDFILTTSAGDRVKLSDFTGRRNIVLFFMRAFSCFQCRLFARRLASAAPQFESHNTQVMIVGPGTRADAEKLSREIDSAHRAIIMHDGTNDVYDRYALDRILFSLIQKSALFVIDREGVIRFAHTTANANHWLSNKWLDEMLDDVKALNGTTNASSSSR